MNSPNKKCQVLRALVVLIASALSVAGHAQTFDEQFEHWPTDLKINGRIVVNNGMDDFDSVAPLLKGIVKDKLVVSLSFEADDTESKMVTALKNALGEKGNFETAKFSEIKTALSKADVVVLPPSENAHDHYQAIKLLTPDFERFIGNGNTLIVDSSMACLLGARFICSPSDPDLSEVQMGLNLLPDCVLGLGIDDTDKSRRELLSILARHPRCVGIGLADKTLMVLSGRKITCHGDGKTTCLLMANEHKPLRIESISARGNLRQRPQDVLIDLTEWRRDAIDRTLDPFPAPVPEKPQVENGTLLIVGGGGMPKGLMERFVELAGGKEEARLVYVPCAEGEKVSERQRTVESWKRMGVTHATFIHTKDRQQSNTDEDFLAPLTDATGIWFGGGRQWNFSDSYYGTRAHKLMKEVLQRGGVIGGSSAGASIQGRYLARATPIGNLRIMAPGYERGGLGFLSGVAIDQHFSQRERQKDMTLLVNRYPQLLGIGLDEATAIVVQKSIADVVGRGRVHFYDRNLPVYPDQPDYIALPEGSRYDLAERKVLIDTTRKTTDDSEEQEPQ